MKIVTVIGARPQFVKAAEISKVFRRKEEIDEVIVHSGQHYDRDMSDQFFEELELPEPRYNLGIGQLPHGAMTGRMLERIEEILMDERPDQVLVYGDTNSTLAGALAAVKHGIPIAHVEAGLRSFNKVMPEEHNRILTDHMSTLLLCPTAAAADNLAREGIVEGVHVVGDVMYDATLCAIARTQELQTIATNLQLDPKSYAVATIHRAENTDSPDSLRRVVDWLEEKAENMTIVLPLHPRTKKKMAEHGLTWHRVTAVAPVGYNDMTALLANARYVFTDSGGLQKEAYFHRVPCVTLRTETEWTETIDAGWNRLWTADDYLPRRDIDVYGDGRSGEKIAEILVGRS